MTGWWLDPAKNAAMDDAMKNGSSVPGEQGSDR